MLLRRVLRVSHRPDQCPSEPSRQFDMKILPMQASRTAMMSVTLDYGSDDNNSSIRFAASFCSVGTTWLYVFIVRLI